MSASVELSLKALAASAFQNAERILSQNESLTPVMLASGPKGIKVFMMLFDEKKMTKRQMLHGIRDKFFGDVNCYVVVLESWMKHYGPHDEMVDEHTPKIMPRDSEDRSECVVICGFSREGEKLFQIRPIIRTDTEVSLGEPQELPEGIEIGGTFMDNLFDGRVD